MVYLVDFFLKYPARYSISFGGHTGFLHLTFAVLALIFIARRIQPSLSLVHREVEFCVPTNSPLVGHTCVCVFSSHLFWTSSSLDVPAGATQEEGHTEFLIHLPSAVRALFFLVRRIQSLLSLVDREVEFCVLLHLLGIFRYRSPR